MTDFVAASNKLIAAYNAKDFVTLRSLLAPDIDMAHFNRNYAVKRREDLLETMEAFAASYMPDRLFQPPERVMASGNFVIRESYWCGTPTVDIPGFGTTGIEVRLRLCSVMRFNDNGILVEWKDYG